MLSSVEPSAFFLSFCLSAELRCRDAGRRPNLQPKDKTRPVTDIDMLNRNTDTPHLTLVASPKAFLSISTTDICMVGGRMAMTQISNSVNLALTL